MIVLSLQVTAYALIFAALTLLAWTAGSAVFERSQLRGRLQLAGAEKGRLRLRRTGSLDWLIPRGLRDQIQRSFEERCTTVNLRLTWQQFAAVSVLGAGLGLGVGAVYLENASAAVLLMIAGFVLPDQLLSLGAGVYRDRTHEQLQLGIQRFAAEFDQVRTVPRAFTASVSRKPVLPDPIRSHFAEAGRRLSQGEDHNRVLDDLALQLRHSYGRLFTRNCKKLYENQQAGASFEDLAHELGQARIRQRQNQAAISGSRLMGVVLNLAVVPAYVVNNQFQPDTREFLTQVSWGRFLLVLIVFSALITFGLNHLLARTE